MKKRFAIIPILIGLVASGTALALSQPKEAAVVDAWSGTQASTEGTYYSSVGSETGSALQAKLLSIDNAISKSKSYDWSRYEAEDEAEGASTYLLSIYTRHNILKTAHVSGSYSWDTWNREHVWTQTAYPNSASDNHNIFACEGKINGTRSNKKFAEVTHNSTNQVTEFGHTTDCYSTSSAFEPCDDAKGEIARSVMYGTVMYSYTMSNMLDIATALKWNAEHPVTNRDIFRNNTVYTLQKNRNPFVDHPEYACKIWGSYNEAVCNADVTPTSISVSPSTASVAVGETINLAASALPSGSSNTVSWSSGASSIASVNSSTGVVTGVSAGSAIITATSTLDSSVSATATVTVKALKSIALSGSASTTEYTEGQTFDPTGLTVTATYTDNATAVINNDDCTWTDTFGGTISLVQGSTSVTCTYGGKSATYTGITVSEATGYTFTKVTTAPSDWSGTYLIVYESSSYAFNGSLTTLDANNNYVSVTISDSSITTDSLANTFSISASGTGYELKSNSGYYIGGTSGSNALNTTATSGTYVNSISITSGDADIVSNTSYLRFNASTNQYRYYKSSTYTSQKAIQLYKMGAAPSVVPVTGITVSGNSSVAVGATATYSAAVTPSNATDNTVTWSVSGSNATINSSTGVVTGASVGSATVTATANDGSGVTGTKDISITAAPTLTSIAVTTQPTKTSYSVGDTLATAGLVITGTYSDSSTADVTSGCTFNPTTLSTAGSQTITATHTSSSLTTTFNVTVSVSTTPTYTLITDASTLSANDTVVIVGSTDATSYYALNSSAIASVRPWYLSADAVSPSGGVISQDGLVEWTVGTSSTNFTFTNSSTDLYGYYTGANNSINYGTMAGTTDITTYGANASNAWTYTIADSSTGLATLCANTTTSVYLQYKLFSSTPEFCGSNSAPTGGIYLFKKNTNPATDYATAFLASITCDGGITAPSTSQWSAQANAYAALSSSVQAELTNAVANVSGTVVEQCVARYDYIISKYGTSSYANFMGRTVSSLSLKEDMNGVLSQDNATMIIVAVVGLTAIGGFFFINKKKKKEISN